MRVLAQQQKWKGRMQQSVERRLKKGRKRSSALLNGIRPWTHTVPPVVLQLGEWCKALAWFEVTSSLWLKEKRFVLHLPSWLDGAKMTGAEGLSPTSPPTPTVLWCILNVQKVIRATLIGVNWREMSHASHFIIVKLKPFSQGGAGYRHPRGTVHVNPRPPKSSFQQRAAAGVCTYDTFFFLWMSTCRIL